MTPAVLSIGPDSGTRLQSATRDHGESVRWVGTAQPQGDPTGQRPSRESLAGVQRSAQTALVPAEVPESRVDQSAYQSIWSRGGNGNGMTGISPVRIPEQSSGWPAAADEDRPPFRAPRPITAHGDADATTVLWQRGFLNSSLAALKHVALARVTDQAIWMDAAQRLRAAAVVGRSRAPRHAALALIFGDALTFTVPEDLSDKSWGCLVQGLIALQEPFISSDRERTLIHALLDCGWSLTGPFDVDTFSRLAPGLFA
jgi:hypothetical protein